MSSEAAAKEEVTLAPPEGTPKKAVSTYKDWSHFRPEPNDSLRRGKEPAQTFPQKLVSVVSCGCGSSCELGGRVRLLTAYAAHSYVASGVL